MALVFPRLAHNFIKNGYYPTDEVTLSRILSALDTTASNLNILDPCCGEGTALAELKNYLIHLGSKVKSYGIEYDKERAWHAKSILDLVVHGDMHNMHITARSQSLLFLNPPYGNTLSDKGQTGESGYLNRLEKVFYRATTDWLRFGGIMVLIVPYYVIDEEFSAMIARNMDRVKAFLSPTKTFKQAVIFGIKKRSEFPSPSVQDMLMAIGRGDDTTELPETWTDEPYYLPDAGDLDCKFLSRSIEGMQLMHEVSQASHKTLWPQFNSRFSQISRTLRQPLREPSEWHMALALAAGQITGLVVSEQGRRLLIKGSTFKDKSKSVTLDEDNAETIVSTDKFVPTISGIDFTPGETYGNVVTIR